MGEISKLLSRQKKDLILETHFIRKEDIITLYDFYDANNYIINAFVRSIHLATFSTTTLKVANLLFYSEKDGSLHVINNQTILDFFVKGASIYTTDCGVIIIFGKEFRNDSDEEQYYYYPKNFLCSTIDMKEFQFHQELNSFLNEYYIYRIFHSDADELVIVRNKLSKSFEAKKLHSQINLQSDNSVSLSFSEYILD